MQPLQRLSEAEQRFLYDGVAQGLRSDGRGCFDCRRISFEMSPIVAAAGSCRLQAGDTDLIVAVKCDISKPNRQTPNMGHFQIQVEVSPSVSVALVQGMSAEDLGRQLSMLLEALCAGDDVVDRQALCVLPGVFAWEVYVDVLVLTSGGNLLDSVSLAMCAALREARLPRVEVADPMEDTEHSQLKVDDRPEMGQPIPLRRSPLCVTVSQIKDRFLLDVTPEEEICADASLCVVVDAKRGDVVGMHKMGRGLFDTSSMPIMLERCKATAASLMKQLDQELATHEAGS